MDAEHAADRALEEAVEWQIRLVEEPGAREAFERWLAADAANRQAWQSMQQLWGALDNVVPPATSAGPAHVVDRPLAAKRPMRRSRWRRWKQLAAASGLAAIALIAGPHASLYLQSDYHTATAQTADVALADGSHVTLGPDTAIRLSQDGSRGVELLKGQAYFQVAPDASRPFVVHAGDLAVRVLGTAFDVEMDRSGTEVALQHGQVQAQSLDDRQGPQISERLLPGDRLRVDWPSGLVQRSRLDPNRVAAWRDNTLFVDDLTVADIVARLERYTPGWIMITDEALKQRRISGVFDLRDPDRALLALAQTLGVPARNMTPMLSVLGNY